MSFPLPVGYRVAEALAFYGRDTECVSESLTSNGFRKCFLSNGKPVVAEIRFLGDNAEFTVDPGMRSVAEPVVARMLGLHTPSMEFERQFAHDPLLGVVVSRQRGLCIPMTPTPWEALAWAIMGQQVNLTFATTLRRNLILLAGSQHSSGLRAHPSAAEVAKLQLEPLRALKFSRSKADYLIGAAKAVASGEVDLDGLGAMPMEEAAGKLLQLRGVGPWTVQYAFMRGLGFQDCLPAGDAGLAQGLDKLTGKRPTEAQIRSMMAKYSPYRSLATYHVWASLKGGVQG